MCRTPTCAGRYHHADELRQVGQQLRCLGNDPAGWSGLFGGQPVLAPPRIGALGGEHRVDKQPIAAVSACARPSVRAGDRPPAPQVHDMTLRMVAGDRSSPRRATACASPPAGRRRCSARPGSLRAGCGRGRPTWGFPFVRGPRPLSGTAHRRGACGVMPSPCRARFQRTAALVGPYRGPVASRPVLESRPLPGRPWAWRCPSGRTYRGSHSASPISTRWPRRRLGRPVAISAWSVGGERRCSASPASWRRTTCRWWASSVQRLHTDIPRPLPWGAGVDDRRFRAHVLLGGSGAACARRAVGRRGGQPWRVQHGQALRVGIRQIVANVYDGLIVASSLAPSYSLSAAADPAPGLAISVVPIASHTVQPPIDGAHDARRCASCRQPAAMPPPSACRGWPACCNDQIRGKFSPGCCRLELTRRAAAQAGEGGLMLPPITRFRHHFAAG